jgi:hypothetical protein
MKSAQNLLFTSGPYVFLVWTELVVRQCDVRQYCVHTFGAVLDTWAHSVQSCGLLIAWFRQAR